jgi:hypothetical protein
MLLMVRRVSAVWLLAVLVGWSGNKNSEPDTAHTNPSALAATYAPRIGVAVRTGARTCLAIKNKALPADSPVTLVNPNLPQSFTEAQIGAQSGSPCPVTKDIDPTITSYELRLAKGEDSIRKLVPLVGVVGPAIAFMTTNLTVQADLDANHKVQTFRSCSANDGIHLTVWSGNPLEGALLWHGYYYEPENPGQGPACTPKEIAEVVQGIANSRIHRIWAPRLAGS